MAKDRVVILQNMVPAYRKAFYNALSAHYDVTVVHTGQVSCNADDRYDEILLPSHRFGPFTWVSSLPPKFSPQPRAVVAMFDIRWPQFVTRHLAPKSSRFLLWGHRYSRHTFINTIRDRLMRWADGVILYGEEELAAMLSRGISRDHIFIAPNTIDVPNHQDTSGARKNSFLYVGRLQERKRLDVILRIFASIIDRLPQDAVFNIVGDGDIRSELEALAASLLPRGRVVFHGAVTGNDALLPLFRQAYAYVSDNVGLGLLHSFAYGVPVVTFQHQAQRQTNFRHGPEVHILKDGNNGLFCTDENLADTMLRLANTAAYAQTLGKNAYATYSETHTLNHMVNGFRQAVQGRNDL